MDECDASFHNCHYNAYCHNTDGYYNCACNNGYAGNGTSCEDIDECDAGTHNCHHNAYCNNTNGSYNCSCKNGYWGNGTDCQDIDECTKGIDDCDSSATCSNVDGSFNCTCNSGYSSDGENCKDRNSMDDDGTEWRDLYSVLLVLGIIMGSLLLGIVLFYHRRSARKKLGMISFPVIQKYEENSALEDLDLAEMKLGDSNRKSLHGNSDNNEML
ncbi:uromodulin-like [Dendronephthya gigantea]|uniref:uromodulin-like n=1 Tax=Dendronephthya gigantea TaxID=151771 RepID=UPI00106A00CD|nr:uromodulin-like [Dendronephthya gigantea]